MSKYDASRPGLRRQAPASLVSRAELGYVKPGSYEELIAVLSSGTVRLPKRLRQVADYLWQNPGEMALGTVTSVAEAAGVQPSALVRFAQTLGYSGFTDLQDLFKSHVKASWASGRAQLPGSNGSSQQITDESALLDGLIGASATSLWHVTEQVSPEKLAAMIGTLAKSELIYIIGSKRAFAVASYASLALSKLGVRNVLIDNVGAGAFEQIGCITKLDAVLAISFQPYNSITPDLTALAKQRGAKIVSITDTALSPLVPLSHRHVEIEEGEFGGFKSVAGALVVAMAIVLGVARRRSKPA